MENKNIEALKDLVNTMGSLYNKHLECLSKIITEQKPIEVKFSSSIVVKIIDIIKNVVKNDATLQDDYCKMLENAFSEENTITKFDCNKTTPEICNLVREHHKKFITILLEKMRKISDIKPRSFVKQLLENFQLFQERIYNVCVDAKEYDAILKQGYWETVNIKEIRKEIREKVQDVVKKSLKDKDCKVSLKTIYDSREARKN
jgi:rubrerythrin